MLENLFILFRVSCFFFSVLVFVSGGSRLIIYFPLFWVAADNEMKEKVLNEIIGGIWRDVGETGRFYF